MRDRGIVVKEINIGSEGFIAQTPSTKRLDAMLEEEGSGFIEKCMKRTERWRSTEVAGFFFDLANATGHFIAIPYNSLLELCESRNISEKSVVIALSDGYIRKTNLEYKGNEFELIEINPEAYIGL